jgi:hypothetical protein
MNERDEQRRNERLKYEMEHQQFLQITEERDLAIRNKQAVQNP